MRGVSSPFLMRRSGQYYVRMRVPGDLVERVGLVEVRRSLGPMRFHEARLLAIKIGAQLKEAFVMMRIANDLTKQELLNLTRDCYSTLELERGQGYVPRYSDYDLELIEQRVLAQDHSAALRLQVEKLQFDESTLSAAGKLSALHNVNITSATKERALEIVQGVARAMIEADQLYIFRLGDRLAPYTPSDPLFSAGQRNVSAGIGLTLSELVEEYMRVHRSVWTPKTAKTHLPKLRLLLEFLGPDRRAEDITRADLLPYPDKLLKLRRNYSASVSKTLDSHQTASDEGRINPTTAASILTRTTGMFRWASNQGYISTNPAEGLTILKPKTKKGSHSRRSFNVHELETIFTAPIFTGARSRTRRFEEGDAVIRDDYFYLPIVAYYTGARLGELVQLHISDVIVDGPTPHISVNEDSPQKHGEDGYKHVKSDAGVRLIPLHPDLFELGFKEFVQQQRKGAGKNARLFKSIKYGADGQPSTVYSKWFGRFLDKIGLPDTKLVFHSFRHTAEDYFRTSLVPKYLIEQVIGHQDQSAAADYGVGAGIEVTYDVVAQLKLPIRIPTLIQN